MTEQEDEKILLRQLIEYKISKEEFSDMLHKTIDREIKESALAGPKLIGAFIIGGDTHQSSLGSGLIKESELEMLRFMNDIVVPAKNMVKYFSH